MREWKKTINYSGSETKKTAYDMTFEFGIERRKKNSGNRENNMRKYREVRQNN